MCWYVYMLSNFVVWNFNIWNSYIYLFSSNSSEHHFCVKCKSSDKQVNYRSKDVLRIFHKLKVFNFCSFIKMNFINDRFIKFNNSKYSATSCTGKLSTTSRRLVTWTKYLGIVFFANYRTRLLFFLLVFWCLIIKLN